MILYSYHHGTDVRYYDEILPTKYFILTNKHYWNTEYWPWIFTSFMNRYWFCRLHCPINSFDIKHEWKSNIVLDYVYRNVFCLSYEIVTTIYKSIFMFWWYFKFILLVVKHSLRPTSATRVLKELKLMDVSDCEDVEMR